MAFTEALRMLITADTGGAVRNITAVGAATDNHLGKSQKTIDKWGKGLTTAGAGMVAFGAAALFGLGKAALASEDAELGFRKLQNSIANNPKLSAASAEGFRKQADAIQDVTAADADAIVAGQAVLAQRKLDANQIKELTPLIVDLARKKGIDEVTAFTLASKAVDGNAGALKRAGISIDEAAFKSDAFGATVDALRSSVGGFAETEGKTFAGSLERMKNELGDVVEGVGTGAVDAFTSLFSVVDAGSDKLNELSPAAQNAIGKFATFGSVALVAAGALSFTIGQAITMRSRFADAAVAVSGLVTRMGGLAGIARAAAGTAGIGAVVFGLKELGDALAPARADISKLENDLLRLGDSGRVGGEAARFLGENFDKLGSAFREVVDPSVGDDIEHITDQVLSLGGTFASESRSLDRAKNTIDDVDKALASLARRDPDAAAAAFRAVTAALEEQGLPASRLKGMLDDYDAALTEVDTQSRTAKGGVDELAGGMGDQADATSDAEAALKDYLDTLSGLFDPLFGATDALMDNQQAQADVMKAEMELAAAVRDHGASSLEAAGAQQALTDAQLKAGKSALDVKTATAELSAAVKDGTVSLFDAKLMLNEWVAQGLISRSTAATLARQFDTTAKAANTLGETDPEVRVSERGGNAVRGTLSKVQQAAVNAGRQRPNVRVSATDRATGTFDIVRRAADLLDGKTATVYINVAGAAAAANALARAGRQHGGPVRSGEAYIVGEKHAEWFVPDQDGHIYPTVSRPMGGVGAIAGGAVPTVIRMEITGEGALFHMVNKGIRTGEIQLVAGGQRVRVGW